MHVKFFLRSVDYRALKYTTFVGIQGHLLKYVTVVYKFMARDIESLKKSVWATYRKRMGSALREYKRKKIGIKLADGKSVGGRGRFDR